MIECVVEHSNNLTALVVYNTFLLFIVKCGYGEAAVIILVVLIVDVPEMSISFMDRVWSSVFSGNVLIWACKPPSCFFIRLPILLGDTVVDIPFSSISQ